MSAEALIARAREAIARARLLTDAYELGGTCSSQDRSHQRLAPAQRDGGAASGSTSAAPTQWAAQRDRASDGGFDASDKTDARGVTGASASLLECDGWARDSEECVGHGERQAIEWDGGARDRAMRAVLSDRLASLRESQAATMHQLLSLRRDQLRLRVQQLSALRCLLRAEALRSETYTETQVGTMLQAVELLGSCLGDVAHASEVLSTAGPGQAMAISQAVSEADARAEEASGIVRSLLDFVRSYAAQVQAAGGASPEGSSLSQSQIDALGEAVVGPRDAGLGERLAGDVCSVCLGEYLESDRVRVMPVCQHAFHVGCIDAWLRVKSLCPMCKRCVQGGGAAVGEGALAGDEVRGEGRGGEEEGGAP